MIKFTIPGQPMTKKNSQRLVRAGARIIPLPSKAFAEYQDKAGYYIPNKWANLDGRYNVRCVYYMPTRRRVDLLNLLGATCDILTHYGVLKDDHSGIVISHDGSRVDYDRERPRVEVSIEEAAT